MIADKKDKIKIAENSKEALWIKIRNEAMELIKQSQNNLIIQKAMKEMAEEKLKPFSKV